MIEKILSKDAKEEEKNNKKIKLDLLLKEKQVFVCTVCTLYVKTWTKHMNVKDQLLQYNTDTD